MRVVIILENAMSVFLRNNYGCINKKQGVLLSPGCDEKVFPV